MNIEDKLLKAHQEACAREFDKSINELLRKAGCQELPEVTILKEGCFFDLSQEADTPILVAK